MDKRKWGSMAARYMALTWLLIGLATLLRIFYAQGFLLVPDETNYWQWARHLDWSYHDQAPMIGWTIFLSTLVFGHTELGVRLPSILAMAVASVFLVRMARHWFGARIAWHAALLSQAVLLFNVGALLATADGLQAAGWAGSVYYAARGLEENRWRDWLLGGFWFGFGLLSKYTMVLFLPCVMAYALLSPVHRNRMAQLKPYAAAVLGLLLFSPVIAWNVAHDWNSARHVAYIGGAGERFAIHLKYFGDYLGSQAALLTPLVFLLILAGWWVVIRGRYPRGEWIYPYLFFTSFPVFAAFGLLSLHTRVYGNWPGAGYVTALLLATALWCLPRIRQDSSDRVDENAPPRKLWWWSVGSAYVLTGLVLAHVLWSILPVPPHLDRAAQETVGWDRLGQRVAQVQAEMPDPDDTFLFGLRYQIASELAFYVPGQPYTVAINRWDRPNVYDYWWQDADLLGKDAVGVIPHGRGRKQLLEVFVEVAPPEAFPIHPTDQGLDNSNDPPLQTFYIYRCYGFKGGLRWLPRQGDVRAVTSD
ncbi:glycosyltransferase family 39 protein [Desulfatitalea alkaliphila]|uniref:Glycosyltransferase family 39 protein n=1 Tax=Desulfatitalea alkaliphila TaxID=2929485 RepID=A0AA41UKS8_9BACT|nr:glycosyltransferase family 39 protein [Desulfatitalea alkaliphila]MCJ8500761.1 glycosyltransferase family 39 protein [Desulfatitalea alkaliphila]